jgi:hypothetical protein
VRFTYPTVEIKLTGGRIKAVYTPVTADTSGLPRCTVACYSTVLLRRKYDGSTEYSR